MYAAIARMTAANHGSTRATPAWPKIARITTMVWHSTAKITGLEKPVSDATM